MTKHYLTLAEQDFMRVLWDEGFIGVLNTDFVTIWPDPDNLEIRLLAMVGDYNMLSDRIRLGLRLFRGHANWEFICPAQIKYHFTLTLL